MNLNPVNASSVLGLLDKVEFKMGWDMLVGPISKPKFGFNELSGLFGTCSQHQITNSKWVLKDAWLYHNLNSIKNTIPSEKSATNILRPETPVQLSTEIIFTRRWPLGDFFKPKRPRSLGHYKLTRKRVHFQRRDALACAASLYLKRIAY